MAASTAGMVVLRNRKTGNTRAETFTMTPTANQYVTWSNTGQTHILTICICQEKRVRKALLQDKRQESSRTVEDTNPHSLRIRRES